jgi:hypothetical protein
MTRLLLLPGVVCLLTFHAFYCANITLVVDNLFGSPWWIPGSSEIELWRYIRNKTGLMQIFDGDLTLSCTADVPIKWKFTEDGVRWLSLSLMLDKRYVGRHNCSEVTLVMFFRLKFNSLPPESTVIELHTQMVLIELNL